MIIAAGSLIPAAGRIDSAALLPVVRRPRILDARHVLPLDQWRAAGWTACWLGSARPAGGPAGRRPGRSTPACGDAAYRLNRK